MGTISTHILTKRMTAVTTAALQNWRYFNSHPHEEDDEIIEQLEITKSISTHILTKRMT